MLPITSLYKFADNKGSVGTVEKLRTNVQDFTSNTCERKERG